MFTPELQKTMTTNTDRVQALPTGCVDVWVCVRGKERSASVHLEHYASSNQRLEQQHLSYIEIQVSLLL